MPHILAFDPGGTTGVASFVDKADPMFHAWQIGPETHHHSLWSLLLRAKPELIIAEEFQYRWEQREKVVLVSKEYIGVLQLYCDIYGVEFVRQNTGGVVGKNPFWSDSKLKGVGLYHAGKPHANDATRHLLHYMLKKKLPAAQELLQRLRPPSQTE